ncbi:hypothetical protein [Thalassobacillus sp. C254]|uniref:hypothetical protein n=1 Tax=Thalassobacillus sp. C254 TaxID=1225341 RepID=UPI0006D05A87|nr:hypothetical protein [Thalassobacillus sp. C254]
MNEEFTNPIQNSRLPKVEINVISGGNLKEIKKEVEDHMVDTDLVVLTDYFGQGKQVQYQFELASNRENTEDWFQQPIKQPLLTVDSVKKYH